MRRFVMLVGLGLFLVALIHSSANAVGSDQDVGDVNCDSSINSLDARDILKYHAGLLEELACLRNSNVDGDPEVTSIDAVLLLKFHAGLINHLPPIRAYVGTVILYHGVEDDCEALDTGDDVLGIWEPGSAMAGDRVRVVGYLSHKVISVCGVPGYIINSYIEVLP